MVHNRVTRAAFHDLDRIPRHGLPPTRPLRPARLDPHARHHDHRRRGPSPRSARRPRAPRPSTWPRRRVNLIDTADVLDVGGDRRPGPVGRRDRVLLATKARMPMGEGPTTRLSRHHHRGLRGEPARLRTDHIDLYRCTSGTADAAGGDLDTLDRVRPARCATSAARTTPAGSSSRRSGSPIACTCSASSASRSTTRCRRARPSTSWCRLARPGRCGPRAPPAACSRARLPP